MRLGDLEFVDLYLGTDFADFKGLKGSENLSDPAPHELSGQLKEIRTLCRFRYSTERDPEFALVIDDVMFRVTMARDITGGEIFVLRRSSAQLRPLNEIGIAPRLTRFLVDPSLRGLVVIAGETGAGKTSTAAAVLKARLDRIGGIAVAIEDPPEVNLNGVQGKGRCMQVRASRRTGGYKEHLVRALRMNPDMILLGEVREEAAAAEVVEAALNGHLVFTTVHAGGVIEAIDRLASLASGHREPAGAYQRLSQGLRMVIWQSLEREPGGPGMRLNYQALSLIGESMNGARSKIAGGKTGHLVQDIDQLMRRLKLDPLNAGGRSGSR